MCALPKTRFELDRFLDLWVYGWTLVFLAALTFSTALMEVASTCAFAGWILRKFRQPFELPVQRTAFWALSLYVLLSSISFFWSEFPQQSFRGIFKVLQQFTVFWVTADCLVLERRYQRALQVLLFSLLLVGLDGIWQYFFVQDLLRGIAFEPASSGPRISASFKNYGILACYLVMFLPLLFARMEKGRTHFRKLPVYTAVAIGFLLLFWTRSRGAWVAFVGGLLFYLWYSAKRVYVLLAFLLAVGAVFLLPRSMVIHLDAEGQEQSLIERFYLWDRAFQVIQARPFTGTGINTYAVAHQKYDDRQNWRVRNYYSHNGYLQIAAETGLPGLSFFLAFLFFYFRRAVRLLKELGKREEAVRLLCFLTGMFNFLVLGLIDTVFHNPQAILAFWFLAGWGAAYQKALISNRAVFSPPD